MRFRLDKGKIVIWLNTETVQISLLALSVFKSSQEFPSHMYEKKHAVVVRMDIVEKTNEIC